MSIPSVTFAMKRMLLAMPAQQSRFFEVPGNAARARVGLHYEDPSQKQAHSEAAEDL